jgi:sensor histidine kinase YesM
MKKRQILLRVLLFLLLITAIRMCWLSIFQGPEQRPLSQGLLDLRDQPLPDNRLLNLDGKWLFYPNKLLHGPEAASSPASGEFLVVPGNWRTQNQKGARDARGYGSYRLRVLVDTALSQTYGIQLSNVYAASEVYVNGRLIAQAGQVATDKSRYSPRNVPYRATFHPQKEEVDIVIQVANFTYPTKGGIIKSIKFGTAAALERSHWTNVMVQWTVIVLLLLHAVFAFILYFIGDRQRVLIYFAVLILLTVFMSLLDDERLLLLWLPGISEWRSRLVLLALQGTALSLLFFIDRLLPRYAFAQISKGFAVLNGLALPLILFAPLAFITSGPALLINTFLNFGPFLVCWVITLRAASAGEDDTVYLLLSATSLSANMIWGLLKSMVWLNLNFYPIDLVITFLAFVTFWFKRHFRMAAKTELLANRLQLADKRKDEFLAITSHELRNPLHAMLNIAQTVKRNEAVMPKKDAERIELLLNIGRRMSFLLNDLLDLKRLKEGVRLNPERVVLQAAAAGVMDMLAHTVEGKPVQMIQAIPADFPPVYADENRVVQILFNLLHNAAKFTPEGSITIKAIPEPPFIRVYVEDTGIGIDEESLASIFEPYKQSESAQTISSGGFGLGLSICKQLVELQGGEIQVQSTLGRGSVFSFTLYSYAPVEEAQRGLQQTTILKPGTDRDEAAYPDEPTHLTVHDQDRQPETESNIEPELELHSEDHIHVLIVDDDPINLTIIRDILQEDTSSTMLATSGAQALTLLQVREWDLVVADVMMPQMSGYELTRAIRERFTVSELPVLLLTARTRTEDIMAGFHAGANDYVAKPVDAFELRTRVKALAGLKRAVRKQLQTEMACLQAQIEPHFLFNTLNSISALGEIDVARMTVLIDTFGHYLQSSFSFHNLNRLVPLDQELDIVRSYLYIEQERFGDRLKVEWMLEEGASPLLPPLTIQPLVENAVRHGILSLSKGGVVRISAQTVQAGTEIAVTDNGIGMDGETAAGLLTDQKRQGGIGLRNTDRRLKQIYGQGLQITCKPGLGTTVSFIVPSTHL